MDYGLKDKVVLVTGSTKGLGKAIAELIAQEEGIPVVTGRREKEVHGFFRAFKCGFYL